MQRRTDRPPGPGVAAGGERQTAERRSNPTIPHVTDADRRERRRLYGTGTCRVCRGIMDRWISSVLVIRAITDDIRPGEPMLAVDVLDIRHASRELLAGLRALDISRREGRHGG